MAERKRYLLVDAEAAHDAAVREAACATFTSSELTHANHMRVARALTPVADGGEAIEYGEQAPIAHVFQGPCPDDEGCFMCGAPKERHPTVQANIIAERDALRAEVARLREVIEHALTQMSRQTDAAQILTDGLEGK